MKWWVVLSSPSVHHGVDTTLIQQRARALNKLAIISSIAAAADTARMGFQSTSLPLLSGTPAPTTSTKPQQLLQSFL